MATDHNRQVEATLHQFRFQIRSAADSVWGKYKQTIECEDARQQAALFTLEYLESGVLAGIERKTGGDPNQIDRYFLRELKCDLLTWAKGIHRERQRERLLSERAAIRTRLVVDNNPYDVVELRMSWPLSCMRAFDGMSAKEIAKERNVSERTAYRMLAEEKESIKEHYTRRS